ncbi:glycosyltransferase family 2 protein [Actinokineospora diospyrosa]|uniref:Glycosyltransferase involved in cell wall bisynthesis n=1 Tax=Actinokineospora diospyrosa TaxID=103728 RepID=A0ABT1II61_9PSEU|nr:glycosyltransferase [Actinokineospora diospyrosa]MCP2272239.1 Glycosyltransferase involved in cell wall bisynthesis [Actinokineospora diospyrosa]
MASVDVVIPCYKYGKVLPTAVRSVLDQPGVDVRVLVIDDCSGDGSADVARELSSADSRVTVLEHEQNKGHIATYNEGLMDWASADYCALLSADDALTPGALQRATRLLDAHPEVGFVYGRPLHWDGSTPLPPARTEDQGWTVYNGLSWLRRRFALGEGCITSPEVVVRTSLQRRLGAYNPELRHTGDIEMWMRFALHADVGYLKGVDQAYYRVHGQNMSAAYYASVVNDLRQRLAAYTAITDRTDNQLPDRLEMDRQVRRVLARDALRRAGRAFDKGRSEIDPVDELVDFAREAFGDIEGLPEWHTLQLRKRLGARRSRALSPLVLTAPARRIRQHARVLKWQREGI